MHGNATDVVGVRLELVFLLQSVVVEDTDGKIILSTMT